MQTSAHYNSVAAAPPPQHLWKLRRAEHSAVKSRLLDWIGQRMPGGVYSVCDLACGRGGDVRKLSEAFPRANVVCVDSSDASVEELRRRAAEMHIRVHAVCCDVLQYTMQANVYDVVLMNFALHYFASCEKHMRTVLSNVAYGLKPGGAFAGTCVDWRTIAAGTSQGFHVPEGTTHNIEDNPWGRQYRYTLPGCVDLDECVVHFPTLVRMAHAQGLHLVKHRPFNGFLHEMGTVPTVHDVNHNYVVFVFRKATSAEEFHETREHAHEATPDTTAARRTR